MKKGLFIAAIAVGLALLLWAAVPVISIFLFPVPNPGSVGIIGGADGPTAILIAGPAAMWAAGIIAAAAAGILLCAAGIWGLKKTR